MILNNHIPSQNHDKGQCTILANGEYPVHPAALACLNDAGFIVCCDGAVNSLNAHGLIPNIVIGDMDSISREMRKMYTDRLIFDPDPETNDLEKAIRWCKSQEISAISIAGGTGRREDHTMGNIFLLLEFAEYFEEILLFSNFGIFQPTLGYRLFKSHPGQAVSVFTPDPTIPINSTGLKFPLREKILKNLVKGTLNESVADTFSISVSKGAVIVFATYEGSK